MKRNRHHDEDAPQRTEREPYNRLGLDYRDVPARKVDCRIVDIHTHVHDCATTDAFFDAARAYGIGHIVTMTPLEQVPKLNDRYGRMLEYIAIPSWRDMSSAPDFQRAWLSDLESFREYGARRMKFWMAPPMRGEFGLSLDHAFFGPLIDKSIELDYEFMVHIGDPTTWFAPGGRYADAARYGKKHDHYPQLEFLLERVAPRTVIAAHMGGNIEEPAFLAGLLDRHPNLLLDSSATKWIVREIARQPQVVRDFVIQYQDRILFGTDLVVSDRYNFEHYASRFWAHQMLWEADYRGESPIEDPDADDPPKLAGLDLPPEVLHKLYHANAERLGY